MKKIDKRMEELIQEHDLFLLIQIMKNELENKVISSGFDLQNPEVLCISQLLDRLIVEYMKKTGDPKD
ncbi:aspartyl-phosphate phosphatase Spo0E family protein [Paenibacillus sedimenti]|uniref:Spo0E family sporulation regulatory protein-aspartic acid phosphatase n=1 Tax=Paenibacillus sedimenti TaxID=2770274 RepID=A0A926KXN2_9BACL|nr:aspartyl-phosphate phosphatase Spo0E family protein [Paenibacillus sedimenti]MBD0383855.1 Spo0E family sporulation regulatory protein-aspartic acid phosphatase [Paenibacillus sedimenti]